jgi:hypothetical protein
MVAVSEDTRRAGLCAFGGAALGVAIVLAVYALGFGYAEIWPKWTAHLCGACLVSGAGAIILGLQEASTRE